MGFQKENRIFLAPTPSLEVRSFQRLFEFLNLIRNQVLAGRDLGPNFALESEGLCGSVQQSRGSQFLSAILK